ncbi:uncharacterized protein [Drosophila virilis]|uniref:NOT2/NOT3/NOT5 C-terminal domain-containing protein n=1 Tax=Drosophila virilis TaxID=7244 RepID=B4LV48_DROVI|nr:general negative regulator of transcription subunit 2 [Drosophila virilis]EDW64308.2 uncharacterized protein Dvir_GJ17398 [Drosophila virilis]
MKRHNAKAIAAAVAIAAAAAASAEGKKKTEQTKQNLNSSALYVDVVKNMSRPESSPPATPPPPKFTILREDFPALPGTHEDLRGSSAAVPDDWTAMISDDDDDEVLQPPTPDSVSERAISVLDSEPAPDLLVELHSSGSSNGCKNNSYSSDHETLDNEPPTVALVAATTDFNNSPTELFSPDSDAYQQNYFERRNSGIFDKQFLTVGVGQRAWSRQTSNNDTTATNIGPPPGFEHIKFYGRLRTNRMGVPLGGVTFDITPPQGSTRRWDRPGSSMEGAYGLAGLASNLEAAQQNPHLLSQIFGHEAAGLNVDAHCCACEANKLHACFAGPLQGGRCAPHEVNYDVPLHYRRAGGQDLPQPKIDQMEVELLFFFFYTYPGDMMQMLAAAELAERGWRFHIYERLWIRRQADNPHYVICGYQESGEYNYFNMVHWKILARHFDLMPEQLERTITKAELREQYGYHPQMSFF